MTRTKNRFAKTLLLACALSAFAGVAKADIVKCTNEQGLVLITDVPCKAGTTATSMSVAIKKPPVRTKALAENRRFAETERMRVNAERNKQPASRKFALDVATSAAARASLASIDQAWALQRQQVLVEQEARPSIWNFWRS